MSSDLSVQRHRGPDGSGSVDAEQLLVVDEPIVDLAARPQVWVCSLVRTTQKISPRRNEDGNLKPFICLSLKQIFPQKEIVSQIKFEAYVKDICESLNSKTLNLCQI